jgi:hypothetical protein
MGGGMPMRPAAQPSAPPMAVATRPGMASPREMIARMDPGQLYQLVEDAKGGKFGPQAQRMAAGLSGGGVPPGGATVPANPRPDSEQGMPQPRMGARQIFSGARPPGQPQPMPNGSPNMSSGAPDEDEDDQAQGPMNAARIFGPGR